MGYIAKDGKNYDWYNLNIALSRNPSFFFDIGARGIGKTTSFALWAFKTWQIKKARWAIVVRRPEEMSIIRQNFWTPLTIGDNYETNFNGIRSYIRKRCPPDQDPKRWGKNNPWQFWGVFLNLSDAMRYKQASQFFSSSNIDKLLFDEFIIEDDSKRYLSTEPDPLFSIASSVFRNRPRRVFCFSNAGFVNNPYFRAYGVTSGDFINSDFKRIGDTVFHYTRQPSPAVYSDGLTESAEQYQTLNIFKDVDNINIYETPATAHPFASIYFNNFFYILYKFKYSNYIFVKRSKVNKKNIKTYSAEKYKLIDGATYDTDFFRNVSNLYKKNKLKFNDLDTKIEFFNSRVI